MAPKESQIVAFMLLITDAYFAFNRGREAEGLELTRKAMALGRENGIMAFLYSTPAVVGCLCSRALEAGIEPDYARALIRKHNLSPDVSGIAPEAWPYPIKIHTLGRFEIKRDDEKLAFPGKEQKKPLELLKALIAFGGRDVPEERLSDALWPDADGDLAHRSLEVNLSRLRKLLGCEECILHQARQLTINPLYCWVDSLALGHLFSRIEESPIDKALPLCDKAVAMYKGPFLPADASMPWAAIHGEALKDRLLRVIETAGRHYARTGEWEKAAGYFAQGIRTEGLAEELHRRLMICQCRLGNHADAVNTYNRFRGRLKSELGIEPSPETAAVYSSILKNR
jgi:DNA-binding SARP family transcriptional activator